MLSPDIMRSIAAEPYEARGILHSEMALIVYTARRLGIEVFIESGRARGQSTYMLAKYLPSVEIHSVEMRNHPDEDFARARLAGYRNVRLWSGDGNDVLPSLAAASNRRMAVLCDGPKGAAAVSLMERCFQHRHVIAGFIHDMRRLDHGRPSPHREAAISRLPWHKFSDAPEITAASGWMDENIIAAGAPAGPAHEAEFGSYGPTVGIFLNANARG